MNTHTPPASARDLASTATPSEPAPESRHIEPATGNDVNAASEMAIKNAASHARDMLPAQDLGPQLNDTAPSANPAFSSSMTEASSTTGNRSHLPAARVLDTLDITIPLPPISSGKATFIEHDPNTNKTITVTEIALPLVPPRLDISKIGFKPGLKPSATFEKVLIMNKDQRPPVTEYLSEQYIEAHRQKFASGKGYCIMSTDTSIERVQANGRIGRSSGNFVLPEKDFRILRGKINAESKRADGDPQKMLETELGFWPGSLKGKELVSYEIKLKPEDVRIPDGRGEGANELWRPGGLLPTGYTEAVIDPAKMHNASKSVLVKGTTSNVITRTRMDVIRKEPNNWTLYSGQERDIDAASDSNEPVKVLKVVIGSVCKTAIYLRLSPEDFADYSSNSENCRSFVRNVQEHPEPFIAESVTVLANVLKGDQLAERKRRVTPRSDGVQAQVIRTHFKTAFEADPIPLPVPADKIDEINDDPMPNE